VSARRERQAVPEASMQDAAHRAAGRRRPVGARGDPRRSDIGSFRSPPIRGPVGLTWNEQGSPTAIGAPRGRGSRCRAVVAWGKESSPAEAYRMCRTRKPIGMGDCCQYDTSSPKPDKNRVISALFLRLGLSTTISIWRFRATSKKATE
jgi:hypothetical protein